MKPSRSLRLLPVLLASVLAIALLPDRAQALDAERLYLAARGDIPWQSLSPEEQEALRRYRGHWNRYDAEQQRRIREGAQHYLRLPPEKRREIERQQRHYRQLSPEEKRRLREEYQRQRR